jgi:prepilin-type N-terminal cleavage/methylation domain-containing protein
MARTRGFTLLEATVVLGILAILAGLSLAAFAEAGGQAAPQNAAHDLSSALSFARERAVGKAHNVWLVVFPDSNEQGTTGNGAYFVVDDADLTFGGAGSDITGGLMYSTFRPPAVIPDAARLAGRPSPVAKTVYLDRYPQNRYPKQSVRFGVVTGPGALAFGAPFASLTPSICSFCSGAPGKGAIIFDSAGRARFVDAAGTPQVPTGYTATGRAASLGLRSGTGAKQYLFAVSGPTAYASFFKK